MFFDSQSHGENGLSSADGRSILVSFSCLDELVSYLYAFYYSMGIDKSLHFDVLPVTVRKYGQKQNCQDQNHETNSLKFSESSSDNTVESIAETLPKVSESAEAELQLPSKCFAGSFAEIFAIEAECFAKHFVNNTLNLHKDFNDTFANTFPNIAHGHSRLDEHLFGSEEIVFCDAEFEDVYNDVLKQSPSVQKRKK